MNTKVCTKCGKDLPLTEYYSRGNGRLRSECKHCHKNYVLSKYSERKEAVSDIKAFQGCAKCGDKRPYVLDFHHRDPSIKDGTISRMTSNNKNMSNIQQEIDKCVVLCANCHREFHYFETKEQMTIEQFLI